jgi:hypothetical protein
MLNITYETETLEVTKIEYDIYNKFWDSVINNNYNILNDYESNIIKNIYRQLEMVKKILKRKIDRVNIIYLPNNNILGHMERLVIGNHGPYVEFKSFDSHIKLKIPEDQEFRLQNKYIHNVKYLWYYPDPYRGIKIYAQLKTVKYADYKIGYYYVSPYDIKI